MRQSCLPVFLCSIALALFEPGAVKAQQQIPGDQPGAAQQSDTADQPSTTAEPEPNTADVPDRIIDEQAAARAKRPSLAARVAAVPQLPLRGVSSALRKAIEEVEQRNIYKSLSSDSGPAPEKRQGVIPLFGGLGMRSGLTVGAEYYRNDFLLRGLRLEVPVRISHRLYQHYTLNFVARSRSPFKINFGGTYLEHSEDNFFGFGPQTLKIDRTSYKLFERSAYLRPEWDLTRTFKLFAEGRFTDASVTNGNDHRFPGTLQQFPDIPGMHGARLFDLGLAFQHDNRDSPGMPSSGGYEYGGVYWNQALAKGDFAYWKLRAEIRHYFPVFGPRRAFELRGLFETNPTRGGSQVPFYEQVVLGGADTLRGYKDYRFYDRAGAVFSATYRFSLNSWLAAFVFGDAGQVGPSLGDMQWGALRKDVGIGMRVANTRRAFVKVMLARSPEATRFYLLVFPRF